QPHFLPGWLKQIILHLKDGLRVEEHPAGGLILIGKKKLNIRDGDAEDDPSADAEDLTSEAEDATEVSWQEHTARVGAIAGEFAARCVDDGLRDAMSAAAYAHDLGKLDWRFHVFLRGGDTTGASGDKPLAKSAEVPKYRQRRR